MLLNYHLMFFIYPMFNYYYLNFIQIIFMNENLIFHFLNLNIFIQILLIFIFTNAIYIKIS